MIHGVQVMERKKEQVEDKEKERMKLRRIKLLFLFGILGLVAL